MIRERRHWYLRWTGGALAGTLAVGGASIFAMAVVDPATAAASGARCGAGAQTLTVQGTATVTSPPNLLTLTLGLSTSASTAAASLTANNTAADAVIAALKAAGVATKDLQTSGLSVQAQYAQIGQAITGYEVDDTVVAKVRKLTGAGSLIDAAVAAGGNAARIDGLRYSVTNPGTLQDKARAKAVHQAVAHASAMAKSAGEHLGPICSLTDETETGSTTTGRRFAPEAGDAAAAPAAATVPVQGGSEQETDQVKVIYALIPGPAKS